MIFEKILNIEIHDQYQVMYTFSFRYTSALLLFGGFALHTLPAAMLFRPFSFYTQGQGQTRVNVKVTHKEEFSDHELKVITHQNGQEKVNNKMTLTSDPGSQVTPEGKSGTTFNKLEQAEESHVTSGFEESIKQQELHPLVPSDPSKQVDKSGDQNEPHELNSSFMKPSKSVSALHDPKTRVGQLIKESSHSVSHLQPWKGSGASLDLSALRKRRSLHTSTASLSVLEFQELPPEVMQLQENDMVSSLIYYE